MATHDLGYYVWQLLKEETETSLFPEFFSIFRAHSRFETIKSLSVHPALSQAVRLVATNHGASESIVERVFNDVLDVLVDQEKDDRFSLFWEFVYYFGDTRLDIPHSEKFLDVVNRAAVYYEVASQGDTAEAIADAADRHAMTEEEVRRVIVAVAGVVRKYEAMEAKHGVS